jgi:hypothetical protein
MTLEVAVPIQPQEAADTLRDIEHAENRSASAFRYQKASPHLFLWGAIWVVGYGLTYVRPRSWLIWIPLLVVGMVGSFWIDRRAVAKSSRASAGWRYLATLLALFLFVTALFAILPPKSSAQAGSVIPLLIALCYVLLGVWTRGTRTALLGFTLGALTVGGYFWLYQYFALWMGGIGGGALILGGFWLRRI